MPKSPFDNMPRELNLYMMSFLGTKKNLKNFGETCKYFNELSKEKSLAKYFEPDFARPGELQDLQLPSGYYAIALSNDCQTIACANNYGPDIRLVDAGTGEVKRTIISAYSFELKIFHLAFTDDDKFLIVAWGKPDEYNVCRRQFRGDGRCCVDVWNIETLKKVCRFDLTEDPKPLSLPQIHVLNNNEFIISFNKGYSKGKHAIYHCNVSENKCSSFTDSVDIINSKGVCVSPDRKILAQLLSNRPIVMENGAMGTAATLNIFNVENGEKIQSIDFDMSKGKGLIHNHPSIYFIDNSTVVCVLNYFIHRINLKTKKVEPLPIRMASDANVLDSFHAQGQTIALTYEFKTKLWDLQKMKTLTTLPYPIDNIIWDDEHKNLIMNGNFDNSYSVKFMHIPHRLEDKVEPVPERSSPRP